MEYVSLLPPEIKLKRLEKKRQGVLIRIFIVLFLVLLAIYAFLLISTLLARSDLESLRSERELVESQIELLREYEVLYNDMNQAEGRANQAMGTVTHWHSFLDRFALTLPPGVWLSDMTLNYAADSGNMNMRGWGFSHRNVTDMLNRIEELETLEDVRIRTSSETAYEGRDAVQFSVDAQLLPGSPFLELDEVQTGNDQSAEEGS
ncbi:MAG: PilN domain-containing protein [Firmicutes bacterium]|nr:PilN domain-containing protein [Bacillota bacterium]